MKKLTSLLLCMVLVLSMFGVNAAAAENTCIEARATVVDDGSVTVVVSAKRSAANARLNVVFDSDYLTYVGYETAFAVHRAKVEAEQITVGLANASSDLVQPGAELVEVRFEVTDRWDETDIAVTVEVTPTEILVKTVEAVEVIAEGWSGYTTWVLTDNGVLTVSPSGQNYNGKVNMRNYWKENGELVLPWGEYADLITTVIIEEGVNAVGQMAFYELPNLKTVVLPESIDEVRNYAFKNATSLTDINLSVVEAIREGAFYGCTALEVVELAEGTIVEDWAFSKVPGFNNEQ